MEAVASHLITVVNISCCFWDFGERILRENGRQSSCSLNLMMHSIRGILHPSPWFFLPPQGWLSFQALCVTDWALCGSAAWSWPVICPACWFLPAAAVPVLCLEFLLRPTTLGLERNTTVKSVSAFPTGYQRIWMMQCKGVGANYTQDELWPIEIGECGWSIITLLPPVGEEHFSFLPF